MGRAMLIVTVLMASLYAGIMTTMQRNILSLPNIVSRNMLSKQAESVSDYALRNAIQNSVSYGQMTGDGSLIKWKENYTNFKIQNCTIDSVNYTFAGANTNFRAVSHVSGNLMGKTIKYKAEIAYSFPVLASLNLNYCIHLEMDQPQFNPGVGSMCWDTSGNIPPNDANFAGDIDTRPNGQGADGWKCASFNSKKAWTGVIWHDGNASMEVSSNFTIITFAKIRSGHPAASLVWLPLDPADVAARGVSWNDARRMPTGGIWYESNKIYFSATTAGLGNPIPITAYAPFTADAAWPHNKDQWHFFALTYDRGMMKGYIDGLPVAQATPPLYNFFGYRPSAIRNKGIYLGREYYGATQSGDTFRPMFGLLDQVALIPQTLTDAEIWTYYNQILNPATIQYIRD